MRLERVYEPACGKPRERPMQYCVFARFDELNQLVVSHEILGGHFLVFPGGEVAFVWRTFDGFARVGFFPEPEEACQAYSVVVDRSINGVA